VRIGDDAVILSIGSISHEAIGAAELLAEQGINATVAVVSSFNPSPIDDIAALIADVPIVLTVESHYVDGGLGSLVAETIAERGINTRLVRAGVREMPRGETGSQGYLEHAHGLSARALAGTLQQALSVAT